MAPFEAPTDTWSRWLKLHLESNEELRPEVTKQLRAIQRLITKLDELVAK